MKSETAVLNVPGASRFTTALSLAVTQKCDTTDGQSQSQRPTAAANINDYGGDNTAGEVDESGSVFCDVTFTVKVAAGMPWWVFNL